VDKSAGLAAGTKKEWIIGPKFTVQYSPEFERWKSGLELRKDERHAEKIGRIGKETRPRIERNDAWARLIRALHFRANRIASHCKKMGPTVRFFHHSQP
jgi:hypothetical protein